MPKNQVSMYTLVPTSPVVPIMGYPTSFRHFRTTGASRVLLKRRAIDSAYVWVVRDQLRQIIPVYVTSQL